MNKKDIWMLLAEVADEIDGRYGTEMLIGVKEVNIDYEVRLVTGSISIKQRITPRVMDDAHTIEALRNVLTERVDFKLREYTKAHNKDRMLPSLDTALGIRG